MLFHLLAPVQTIFPELKMSAVVLGSLIRMMTAAKRFSTQDTNIFQKYFVCPNQKYDHLL